MSCAVVACVVLCRPMPTPTRSRTTCGRPSTRRRGRGAGCRTASPSRPSWTPGQYKRDTRYSPSGRQLYTGLDSTEGIPGTHCQVDSYILYWTVQKGYPVLYWRLIQHISWGIYWHQWKVYVPNKLTMSALHSFQLCTAWIGWVGWYWKIAH